MYFFHINSNSVVAKLQVFSLNLCMSLKNLPTSEDSTLIILENEIRFSNTLLSALADYSYPLLKKIEILMAYQMKQFLPCLI